MLHLLQTVLFTFLVLPIRENHAQGFPLEMIPDVKERVIEGGTELYLTCIVGPDVPTIPDSIVFWQLPDGIVSDQADPEFGKVSRLRQTFNTTDLGNGKSIRFSTMTLSNTSFRDTGYYTCNYRIHYELRDASTKQYVYISSDLELVFIDKNKLQNDKDFRFDLIRFLKASLHVRKGGIVTIPCKPTHPNVTVSLVQFLRPSNCDEKISRYGTKSFTEILLTDPTSNWSFDPKQGLTLKDAKFSDSGSYHCKGQMNNFTYSENFEMSVSGLERVGDPNTEPQVGSNISFICRTNILSLIDRREKNPFKWFYQMKDTGEMQLIDEANPPKRMQIRENCRADLFEQSRLDLIEITRDTPTTIRCEDDVEKISETISFRIKELQ